MVGAARARAGVALSVALLCCAAACTPSVAPPPSPVTAAAPTPVASASPSPASTPALSFTLALDPGHNGGNATHVREINAPVPDGRGGTKACNTVGTATASGYPEHAFNFDVATRMIPTLERAGITVITSRDSDDGVGPCVDERGTFADGADALVSLHANGSATTTPHGFFLIVTPEGAATSSPTSQLAAEVIAQLRQAGFEENPGVAGALQQRTDIAGLNHAAATSPQLPAVLIELGEMRNPDDAAVMESPAGRQRYADALAAAIISYASRP